MPLIDVVNLNGDASCLSSAKWLRCLEGGRESLLMRILGAYVSSGRKVNLGPVGATAMDIARFNPEAIEFINAHPHVFEIVLRPFAHDNALLRLPAGFRHNAETGMRTLRELFRNVNQFYLAPEIMVTSEQVSILAELGVSAVFLHKGRYDVSVARHVPDVPFEIHGVFSTPMLCIPFSARELETAYLHALHGTAPAAQWAEMARRAAGHTQIAVWRDGESCLLHPLGPQFEAGLLAAEAEAGVERTFLSELPLSPPRTELPGGTLRWFPLHSMKPWLETMKLYWFVERTRRIEQSLETLDERLRRLWLLTINSDILSAAEKSPPVVNVSEDVLRAAPGDPLWDGVIALSESGQLILTRSERAGEGEDYLAYLEAALDGRIPLDDVVQRFAAAAEPHLRKAWARTASQTRPTSASVS